MNTNSNNRKSTIRTVAKTWILTPVMATSFLIGTTPSFATIDNSAVANGTYNAGAVNSPTSNLVQIPVASSNASLSVAKSVKQVSGLDVSISSGLDATIVDANDKIVYQYIVTNNGNVTISSVVPIDPKPKFGTAQVVGTGTFAGFVLVPAAQSTTLAPGQAVTYTNTYTLSQLDVDRAAAQPAATAVNNSATATGTPASGILGPVPPGVASTTIPAGPVLSISKTGILADNSGGTTGKADVGEIITYTYTVKNAGNVAITNVSINDTHEGSQIQITPTRLIIGETLTGTGPLFPGVTSTDATANDGVWSVLQPGETITFTYAHTVKQAEFDAG